MSGRYYTLDRGHLNKAIATTRGVLLSQDEVAEALNKKTLQVAGLHQANNELRREAKRIRFENEKLKEAMNKIADANYWEFKRRKRVRKEPWTIADEVLKQIEKTQEGKAIKKPKRIQRKRTKGWRLPKGAKCVTRPGKWGNPFDSAKHFRKVLLTLENPILARSISGEQIEHMKWIRDNIHELKGLDLACFCPLDKPCHADVLIEFANEEGDANNGTTTRAVD